MLLKRTVKASSIAETVIALTIIALCFGVASLIFIRTTSVTSRFLDVRKQTEIQSQVLQHLYQQDIHETSWDLEGVGVVKVADETSDSLQVLEFRSEDDKIVWKQQIVNEP